jgi:hypothetical protein
MSPSTTIRLMTDAVIAEYIHEISVRHRPRRGHLAGGDGASAASSPSPSVTDSSRFDPIRDAYSRSSLVNSGVQGR